MIQNFPRSLWTNSFSSKSEDTFVIIVIKYDELEPWKIIQMGFKEGFAAGLQNPDALLETMQVHAFGLQNRKVGMCY